MPGVNDMVVHQAATILNQLQQQATGQATGLISTRMDFVSAATTLLKSGYDPIMNALSQMWTRTIFSVRPYSAKFPSLEMDADRWGNATRKVSFADKPVEDDERFLYPVGYDSAQDPANGNGLSVDMFKLHKDDVQQMAFYGQSVYEDARTIFRDNLDVAFTSPEEFMRYNAAAVQARSNKLEQYREDIRRGLVCNAIGALGVEATAPRTGHRTVHLLTEYNEKLGLTGDAALTVNTVMQPDNFPSFIRWLYAKITTIARRMGERSNLYQTVVDGKQINRHTTPDRLRIFMLADIMDMINSMVRSITYHDDYLRDATWEGVSYWQSINTPDSVFVRPYGTNSDGSVINMGQPTGTRVTNVVGLMFDADAMGSAITNYWSSVTPFNAAGGYWNDFIHANFRTRFDMTEKIVLLLLD